MRTSTHEQQFTIKKQLKHQRLYQGFLVATGAFFLAFLTASVFTPIAPSSATQELQATLTAGDYYVNVSAEPTVSLSISTTDFGNVVSAVNSLSASTNIPSGYQIYFSTGSNNEDSNRLYLNGDSSSGYLRPNTDLNTGDLIPASSPAPLGTNMWGYTISSTNVDNNLWSAVPVLGNDELVAEESSAGEYTETIYLGVKATTDMQSGSYTGTLAYTIIADAPIDPMNPIEISPSSGYYFTPVEIKVTLADASTTLEDLGTITTTIGGEACQNPTYAIDEEKSILTINCNTPKLPSAGMKDVEVSIERFGKTYTLTDSYAYDQGTIQDLTYMHEMSGTICNNTEEGVTTTLKDIRGSYTDPNTPAEYGVIKAKDGNCWMTDNLNLYDMTITSDDSDFPANAGGTTATYTIPSTSTWSNMYIVEPKVHRGTGASYASTVYYDWTVAVALASGSTTEQQDQSICPKNWQLPVDGDANTDKSYVRLMGLYGVTSKSQLANASNAAYSLGIHNPYGYWSPRGNDELNWGNGGGLWTSTPTSSSNAIDMYITSTIQFHHNEGKGYGFPLRCVSRD